MFWSMMLAMGIVSTLMYILCDIFRVEKQDEENSR
jgi:hypothetical protein